MIRPVIVWFDLVERNSRTGSRSVWATPVQMLRREREASKRRTTRTERNLHRTVRRPTPILSWVLLIPNKIRHSNFSCLPLQHPSFSIRSFLPSFLPSLGSSSNFQLLRNSKNFSLPGRHVLLFFANRFTGPGWVLIMIFLSRSANLPSYFHSYQDHENCAQYFKLLIFHCTLTIYLGPNCKCNDHSLTRRIYMSAVEVDIRRTTPLQFSRPACLMTPAN